MSAVLLAGVGNVLRGDDAFGVEVVQYLTDTPLPGHVTVRDYGLRIGDLARALTERYDATLLVTSLPRGGVPGTLYTLERDLEAAPSRIGGLGATETHDADRVLADVVAMKGRCRYALVLGCEPESFGEEPTGRMGLSGPVAAAAAYAVGQVQPLLERLHVRMQAAGEPGAEAPDANWRGSTRRELACSDRPGQAA